MIVQAETRYRVFGSANYCGNPVTLFEVNALDASDALQRAARDSTTEDNVFFTADKGTPLSVRFFSSTAELWLCGHGLLALSYHLRARGISGALPVHSPSGAWSIYTDASGPGVLMPAQRGIEVADAKHWMKQALRSSGIGHERLYQCPNDVWIVELPEMAELLTMEAATVAGLPCGDNRPGALIAALRLPESGYGFRYFAPWHGKHEDSGTGSAHCYLAPLMAGTNAPLTALQFSPEGVAEMRVCLRDDVVAVSGKVEEER